MCTLAHHRAAEKILIVLWSAYAALWMSGGSLLDAISNLIIGQFISSMTLSIEKAIIGVRELQTTGRFVISEKARS